MMHLNDTLRKIPGIPPLPITGCRPAWIRFMPITEILSRWSSWGIICCLSPSYLTKIFKDSFKVTPIQYLINYRIERACHMLLQEDLSIEDIALKNGFNSANYFSRIFKQVVGISPKKYRHEEHIEMVNSKESQQLIVHYEVLESRIGRRKPICKSFLRPVFISQFPDRHRFPATFLLRDPESCHR